ncbi:hypothetical protein GCM10007920_46790 [Ciceribacter naphthalenivorans]|uniref:Uncharacterized protein n=2 Tax=Alphaproteobacteria TaxID=28211 RepID=A0A512HFX4_9HYPH|nr:hypothetical protein RNA01_12800 [Ciceribacter naphthalenivorans]GLR24885.1 hypothetical protein GCM10007920_46790 [Ciceribacter naphthalenivorans]GLT07741.1 hypothetical protein GCM10007926_46790 [Sphingomonas psychrolutea]
MTDLGPEMDWQVQESYWAMRTLCQATIASASGPELPRNRSRTNDHFR